MAITYLDQNFIGLQEYIDRIGRGGPGGIDPTPIYAHPVDGWIIRTLNATSVKSVMNKAMDALVSAQFGHDLASSVFIDQKSFPDLFEVLSHCSKTLGIPIPHAVARQDNVLFNASTAGTDDYAFIQITTGLCKFYSRDEICFVIGHECGHIASGHMVYHTLARLLTDATLVSLGFLSNFLLRTTAGVPLLAWSRRSEVTADRAGLLCCGDIDIAGRALLKLVTGIADVDKVDLEDYIRRFRAVREYHTLAKFHELFASHPEIPKRIESLILFADSEIYYSLSGKPRPEGKVLLSQEELNQRVSQIVKP